MASTAPNLPARRRKQLRTGLTLVVLLGPAVAMVAGVLGYAVVSGAVTSLFRVEVWTLGTPFVGFENYQRCSAAPPSSTPSRDR
jgi:ABC-type sugar transport system permease subunit